MRFDLIDRELERDSERIVALKNVSSAEEYLADHFPGFAVLPGVMMLETLVQAGRRLLADRDTDPKRPLVLGQIRNLRYGNMVRPGQALKVEVSLRGPSDDGAFDLQGIGYVEGQVAVQGRFSLTPMPTD